MTFSVGNIVVASDYMLFRGVNDANVAYTSSEQATNAVAALVGVGYSSRGYGYASQHIPAKAIGQLVQANDWNSLRAGISVVNNQINTPITLEGNVTAGTNIIAWDGSSGRPNLSTIVAYIDSNRLYPNPEVMSLTNVLNSQRTTSWDYATNLYHEFIVNFDTEDDARFFFNTGGAIYISANRNSGPATQMNAAVTQMLTEMGTIIFSATGVTYTGYNGNVYSLGFYDLTDTFEQIFSHYGDQSSMYSNISYVLTVRAENVVGVNGGNGNQLRFQAIFRLDDYTQDAPPYEDFPPTVTGVLTSSVGCYISNNLISDNIIPEPVFNTTVGIGP